MNALQTVLRYEMLFMLTGLILIVGYRLLTLQMNTRGLLRNKSSGRAFSPGRLQLLVVTLGIGLYYMLTVFESRKTNALPHMPNEFLVALGASHTVYLGGKIYGVTGTKGYEKLVR